MLLQLLLNMMQSKYQFSQPGEAVYEPVVLLLDGDELLLLDGDEVLLI
jgi:hypothetical protein